jgi:hypothetical protein
MITPKIADARVDNKHPMDTKQEIGMTTTTTMAEVTVADDLDLSPDEAENDIWTKEQNQ